MRDLLGETASEVVPILSVVDCSTLLKSFARFHERRTIVSSKIRINTTIAFTAQNYK